MSAAPYPSAQRPTGFGGVPSGQGGQGPYPAAGQPQQPTGAANFPPQAGPAVGRPIQGSFGGPAAAPVGGFGGPAAAPAFGNPTGSAGGFGGNVGGGNIGSGQSSAGPSPSVQNDDTQEGDYSAIPGTPEVDYPIFSEIPETSFDCSQQQYPGEINLKYVKAAKYTIHEIFKNYSNRLLCRR